MGYYVHLSVTFDCDGHVGIRKLAHEVQPDIPGKRKCGDCTLDHSEVHQFLDAVINSNCVHMGHKGGLFTWGIVGNYTHVSEFVDALKPFWEGLLLAPDNYQTVEDGPLHHNHILVFEQTEDADSTTAYEISTSPGGNTLLITQHDNLPFGWSN